MTLEAHNTVDLYVRVRYHQHVMLPISLISEGELMRQDQRFLLAVAMGAGVLLVIVLYNLFVYFTTQLRSYLYYVGLVSCVGMYFLGMYGFSYQYLWPDWPVWNGTSSSPVLQRHRHLRRFVHHRAAGAAARRLGAQNGCSADGAAGFSIACALLGRFELSNQITTVLNLLAWGTFASIGLRAWMDGKSYAGYYTLAWSSLFVVTSILCLAFLQVIEFDPALLHYSGIAFLGETVLNSIALGSQIRDLQNDRQQAIAEGKARLEFLAKMSHELRTPMNGVLGMAELLDDRLQDPTNRRYASTIVSSARMLLTIINDILDYSKITSGNMELERIRLDLRDLVGMTIEMHRGSLRDVPVALRAEIADGMSTQVMGDPTRINQVLLNLVSNAVKFTKRGHITIHLRPHPIDADVIELAVEDTGVGIAADHLEHLFDAFRQADASISRSYGGTGLGLAISRQLVELMGGTLTVSSSPGVGSTFTAALPLQRVAGGVVAMPTAEQASVDDDARRLKILVAEDNAVNRLVVRSMLDKLSHNVDVVEDGEAALNALVSLDGPRYDLVLMDCEMPVMDGYTATAKLRAWEHAHAVPRTPVFALTAHVLSAQEQSCLDAGMDQVLTKPIELSRLRAALAGVGNAEA